MGTITILGKEIAFDAAKKYKSIAVVKTTRAGNACDLYQFDPPTRLNGDALRAAPIMFRIDLEYELQLIDQALTSGTYNTLKETQSLQQEDIPALKNAQDLYTRVLQIVKEQQIR